MVGPPSSSGPITPRIARSGMLPVEYLWASGSGLSGLVSHHLRPGRGFDVIKSVETLGQ
jgi:hypothetical protein